MAPLCTRYALKGCWKWHPGIPEGTQTPTGVAAVEEGITCFLDLRLIIQVSFHSSYSPLLVNPSRPLPASWENLVHHASNSSHLLASACSFPKPKPVEKEEMARVLLVLKGALGPCVCAEKMGTSCWAGAMVAQCHLAQNPPQCGNVGAKNREQGQWLQYLAVAESQHHLRLAVLTLRLDSRSRGLLSPCRVFVRV
jgi:hypothetical protein